MSRALSLASLAVAATACGRIDFTPGVDSADLRDDRLEGEFGLGVFDHVTYADGLVLDAASDGAFTSRVFVRPSGANTWDTIAWVPAAPYRKALPDARGIETGYDRGSVDMTDNIALLHLDGASTSVVAGDVLADASGRHNDFVVAASGMPGSPGSYVPGLVGQALSKGRNLYGSHDIQLTDDFQFGIRDFTWALWVSSDYCSPANTTYWGTEDADLSPHIWLGCGSCNATGGTNTINGFYRGTGGGAGVSACGGPPLDTSAWHHVAVVKTSDSVNVQYTYFLDGQQIAIGDGPASSSVDWTPPVAFTFTAFHVTSFPDSTAPGQFDEAALWTRALGASEIAALYNCGALGLELQLRFCTDASCSDGGEFVGPDGTTATAFRESASELTPPSPSSLAALSDTGRPYAQYRVRLAALAAPNTPRLRAVELTVR